jgi:hypothetical protein
MKKSEKVLDKRLKPKNLDFDRSRALIQKYLTIKLLIPFLICLLILTQATSLISSGDGTTFDFDITSSENTETSSSSFRSSITVGDTGGSTSSSNFRTEIGSLRTAPYLNGESCQIA